MKSLCKTLCAALGALTACTIISGCSHPTITAPNAAPGISPATNRQAMIQWHRQHDIRPAALKQ